MDCLQKTANSLIIFSNTSQNKPHIIMKVRIQRIIFNLYGHGMALNNFRRSLVAG